MERLVFCPSRGYVDIDQNSGEDRISPIVAIEGEKDLVFEAPKSRTNQNETSFETCNMWIVQGAENLYCSQVKFQRPSSYQYCMFWNVLLQCKCPRAMHNIKLVLKHAVDITP